MNDPALARIEHLLDLRRGADAVAAAREYLATAPDDHDGLAALVRGLLIIDAAAEAHEISEGGCATYPSSADMHLLRAHALAAQERLREALAASEIATQLEPNGSGAWTSHAHFLTDFADAMGGTSPRRSEVLAEAASAARRAIELRPMDADLHFTLGRVHVANKEYFFAEQAIRHGLELDANSAHGHQLLGVAQRLSKNKRAAGDSFLTAGQIDPGAGNPSELLAWAKSSPWQWVVISVFVAIPVLSFLDGSYQAWMGVLGLIGIGGAAWLMWGRPNRLSSEADAARRRGRRMR